MPRKSDIELKKHTLNLRAGDMDTLAQLFPRDTPANIVRRLVSLYVDKSLSAAAPKDIVTKVSQEMEPDHE